MQVGDGDDLESLLLQIAHHVPECWKALGIHRKRAIVLLVVDVEIDNVCGNFSLAEFASHFAHARFRIVTVTALLIPEGKQRGQWSSANQCGEILNYALGIGTVKEIVVQFTAVGSEGIEIAGLLAKIEVAAIGVIQIEPVRGALSRGQQKWNALIQRISGLLPPKRIR